MSTDTARLKRDAEFEALDVVIVGAGFAGLFMLYRLRELGFAPRVFEAAADIGGTWYFNRYPGARCDVESMQYSYSFSEELQQDWTWTERFARQPEILEYINHVADRFDLRGHIQLETRVEAAKFDQTAQRWTVRTSRGTIQARVVIMASGCLSASKTPDIEGLSDFKGRVYFTSSWPHEGVDFSGQRVGLVGTGSSGIQAIPEIAKQAAELVVFQRTPNYIVPAQHRPLSPEVEHHWKSSYAEHRAYARTTPSGSIHEFNDHLTADVTPEQREAEYERRWEAGGPGFTRSFGDLTKSLEANHFAAEFVRRKITAIVTDARKRDILTPLDYPLGAKRICVDDGYYETFNLESVDLVDVRATPITRVTPAGIRTTDRSFEFDSLVFAIGFDAMTGPLLRVAFTGREGETLKDKWAAGPRTYLGLMTAGFPNLFTITGPGSPSVLSNVIVSIEQHVEWIAACLAHARSRGADVIEADRDAEDAWVDHVNEVASKTLFMHGNSWYLGANVPGKPRVFMPYPGGVGTYRLKCDEIVEQGYRGFHFSPVRQEHAA